MILGRVARWIGLALLAIAILLAGVWCSLAVWFRCGAPEPTHTLLSGGFWVLAVTATVCIATFWRRFVLALYSTAVGLVVVWWVTIEPSTDRNWVPEIAHSATGAIDGDRLVVSNVRNFTWRSDTDFDQVWEQRYYDLSRLTDVELIMSYWAGEAIAHTIVSFGFDDGTRIAFSVEEKQETYSSVAGFLQAV
jgi:hypothetical protein